jgi:uncharacterized membrane protein HdeD (DUF308 family)
VGLVSVLAGIAILVWPTIGILSIAIIAGIYALIAGVPKPVQQRDDHLAVVR